MPAKAIQGTRLVSQVTSAHPQQSAWDLGPHRSAHRWLKSVCWGPCRYYRKLRTWMERAASGPRGGLGPGALKASLLCTRRASRLWETEVSEAWAQCTFSSESDGHGQTIPRGPESPSPHLCGHSTGLEKSASLPLIATVFGHRSPLYAPTHPPTTRSSPLAQRPTIIVWHNGHSLGLAPAAQPGGCELALASAALSTHFSCASGTGPHGHRSGLCGNQG